MYEVTNTTQTTHKSGCPSLLCLGVIHLQQGTERAVLKGAHRDTAHVMPIPRHPSPCSPTAHPHHTWLWLQLCNLLPIPHPCAMVYTEHPSTCAASATLCQRCGLGALSPRGLCPCPLEAVCFMICEHQEEMKQWWRIPFSKALMVKNVLLGCLFHSKGKKEKKGGEGGGRRERNHLLFLEAPHPGSRPALGKLLLSQHSRATG